MIVVWSVNCNEGLQHTLNGVTYPYGRCPGGWGPRGPVGWIGEKGSNLAPGGTPLYCDIILCFK